MMYTIEILFFIIAALSHQASCEDSSVSSRACEDEKECENKACGTEEKSVICYFTNWAVYRKGGAQFTPDNIDPTLCSQINYAVAILHPESLTVVPFDEWADVDEKFFKSVVALKEKGLKVLLTVGGDEDSTGEKWSRLIRNTAAHAPFVSSALDMIQRYGFDGLDIEYTYPGCPKGDVKNGQPTDNDNFNKLMSDLKTAFKGKYLLAVAAASLKDTVDKCFKMADLCETADQINIKTYNYHGLEEGKTAAIAPMFGSLPGWGVLETVKYFIDEIKCPAEKLVVGVPFYGATFTLADKSQTGFGAASSGAGQRGPHTGIPGAAAYYEICHSLKDGWKSGFDKVKGSYAWHDDQFVSMPSQVDMIRKSCLIRRLNLKGVHIWTIDYDDFNDMCGCGSYPLLKTLNRELRGKDIPRPPCY